MPDRRQDLDDLRALIQLYIAGTQGDVADLTQALLVDGHLRRQRGLPPTDGSRCRVRVRSIDLTGAAGVRVLVEVDYPGTDKVEGFAVARSGSRWRITNQPVAADGRLPMHRLSAGSFSRVSAR